jgi:hypothetical protein
MARVNMFLRMMGGGKVKDAYRKADQDVAKASIVDISDFWQPEEEDLALAALDLKGFEDFDFDNIDELYIDEEKETEKWFEI